VAIQKSAIRRVDGAWQLWHHDELVSRSTTYLAAIRQAEALAREAALRGERSKIVVEPVGGVHVEFPVMEPE
jgi:hypothetical protein